jgi:hypothetical protein
MTVKVLITLAVVVNLINNLQDYYVMAKLTLVRGFMELPPRPTGHYFDFQRKHFKTQFRFF